MSEPERRPRRIVPAQPTPFVVRVGDQIIVFDRMDLPPDDGPRCVAKIHDGRRCSDGIRHNRDPDEWRGRTVSWVVEGLGGVIRAKEPDIEDQALIRQRCTQHLFSAEPDAVAPEWELFDPEKHSHLIQTRHFNTWTPAGVRKSWDGPEPMAGEDLDELLETAAELTRVFSERIHPPFPTAVYRYYDADDVLLYVGVTGDLAVREVSHIRDSSWMDFAVRSTIERYPTRPEALDAEREAIQSEAPLFNIAHNIAPGMTRRLVEYLVAQDRPDLLMPKVSRG